MDNTAKLKEQLKTATAFHEIFKSDNFQTHVFPHFKTASVKQYVDPAKFKTRDEYVHALDVMNNRTLIYNEIIALFEGAEARMQRIEKDIKNPSTSFANVYESTQTTPAK